MKGGMILPTERGYKFVTELGMERTMPKEEEARGIRIERKRTETPVTADGDGQYTLFGD